MHLTLQEKLSSSAILAPKLLLGLFLASVVKTSLTLTELA